MFYSDLQACNYRVARTLLCTLFLIEKLCRFLFGVIFYQTSQFTSLLNILQCTKSFKCVAVFFICIWYTVSIVNMKILALANRLTLEQKELCRSRLKLLIYLDRLETYEVKELGNWLKFFWILIIQILL